MADGISGMKILAATHNHMVGNHFGGHLPNISGFNQRPLFQIASKHAP